MGAFFENIGNWIEVYCSPVDVLLGISLGVGDIIKRIRQKKTEKAHNSNQTENSTGVDTGAGSITRKPNFYLLFTLIIVVCLAGSFMWKNSFLYIDGERVEKSVHRIDIDGNNITNLGALKHYGNLESLVIAKPDLSDKEIGTLRSYLEEEPIHCTVEIFDQNLDYYASHIDLSGNTGFSLQQLENRLALFPNVDTVDVSGCGFSSSELKNMEQATNLDFVWEISLGGETFKTSVTEINLTGRGITDISDLQYCEHLTTLNLGIDDSDGKLRYNNIRDISPLAQLKSLIRLGLTGNNISDISALAGLTNLQELGLGKNNISDISALAGMSEMTWLYLNDNNIIDISPLSGMSKLNALYLSTNNVDDISVLAELKALKRLGLGNNKRVKDISVVAYLEDLEYLYLAENRAIDLTPASNLKKLSELYLSSSRYSDSLKEQVEEMFSDCRILWR